MVESHRIYLEVRSGKANALSRTKSLRFELRGLQVFVEEDSWLQHIGYFELGR